MGFSQALSGLSSAAKGLDVVSNNISNSQTVGFKSSTTRFADVYAGAQGLGVKVAGVVQNFSSGPIENTGRPLDLAISGDGFFRFEQGGQVVYSRNGQLSLTPDGFLENAQGARLLGRNGAINVPSGGMAASATTQVNVGMNFEAGSPVITATFDPTDTATYSYANTATVYDSLGTAHDMTMYFVKTAPNEWAVHTSVDGNLTTGSQTVKFTSSGALDATYAATDFTIPLTTGADNLTFSLNLAGSTQFGNKFEANSLFQDGYTSGSLAGFSINENGQVVANYSNDRKAVLDQLQLASFRSPEGLRPMGDNMWVETVSSGQPLVGEAGTGQLGSLLTGAVEGSNVDLTAELVNLIIAQRNYQANAQSVKSQSEVLENAVNLSR